jgi:hypothetical protein
VLDSISSFIKSLDFHCEVRSFNFRSVQPLFPSSSQRKKRSQSMMTISICLLSILLPSFAFAQPQQIPLVQTPDSLNWNVEVSLGSYGMQQNVQLIFDTGSAEVTLFGWSKCNNPMYSSSKCYQWNPKVSQNFTYSKHNFRFSHIVLNFS